EYRAGPYFNISDNRCIDSSDYAILVAANSAIDGYGLVERNTVTGGGSVEGIRVSNYDHTLVRENVVTGTTGSIGINSPAGAVIIENNKSDKAITGGIQLVRITADVGNADTGEDNLMSTSLVAKYLAKNG